VRTLHHYDQIGLLRPTRSSAGHRRYTEPDVARLTQVVALRGVGLSLGEIRRCLDSGEALAPRSPGSCATSTCESRRRQHSGPSRRRRSPARERPRPRQLHLMALIGATMMIAEGKTKIVEEAGDGEVLVRSKDDINRRRRSQTRCARWQGCRIHADEPATSSSSSSATACAPLRGSCRRRHLRARNVDMIPLELVARRAPPAAFETAS